MTYSLALRSPQVRGGPTVGKVPQSRVARPKQGAQLRGRAQEAGRCGPTWGLSAWKRGRVLGSAGAPGKVMSGFVPAQQRGRLCACGPPGK